MKKIPAYLKFPALVLGLLAFGSDLIYAGAPMKINFQGRLEESGQPAEGAKNFVFKIYDALSGGSLIWTSQTQSLTLSKGVFSAVLSAGSPAAISTTTFSAARYIEITIDGVPLSPLQEMVSAPYALVAQALAADAQLPSSSIAEGAVTDAKVALTTAAISSGRFGDDRVIMTTGAFTGGFNAAYKLVQLDVDGRLPALDGSALTNIVGSQVNLSTVTAAIEVKLSSGLNSGYLFVGSASNRAAPVQMGGDVTMDNAGATAIGAAKVQLSMLNSDIVALDAAGKVGALDSAHFASLDGSALTGLNPANLSAAVANTKGGTGQDSGGWTGFAKVNSGAWSAAALASGDIPSLDASKITTGKFQDGMMSISTGAFPGGFNGADQLARLDPSGRLGISTGTVNSALTVGGAVSLPIKRITNADTPYLVSENDHTILANATDGAITVTLPDAAAVAGRVHTIKRVSSSGTVTIGSAGGQIDGAAFQAMNTLQGESMLLQSDGTDWQILSWYWQ